MKAFVEVSTNTTDRPIYNENTLECIKTITVYKPYPYAYGFLLNTKSGDGAHLDCYFITERKLRAGEIVDVRPIGMVESFEDGEEDHKILVALPDESPVVDQIVEKKIRDFAEHYFDSRPEKKLVVGRFLGYDEAVALIDACKV